VSGEVEKRLVLVVAEIDRKDPDLARQLKKARNSIPLNVSEGSHARGARRNLHYGYAKGSAQECIAILDTAVASQYIKRAPEDVIPMLKQMLDRGYVEQTVKVAVRQDEDKDPIADVMISGLRAAAALKDESLRPVVTTLRFGCRGARWVALLSDTVFAMAATTGMRRRYSSRSSTGIAPGLVDSAPISSRSAPSSTRCKAWSTARCGSSNLPPSKKESGVTLIIPMRKGRLIPSR